MSKVAIPSGWRTVRVDGFMAHIGPLLRSETRGERKVFALETTHLHSNHVGLVHGGVLTSLLDQALAIVAWDAADRQPIVTVQMETQFLAPARAGDFLQVRPRIRHATRSMVFAEADLTSGSRLIAVASAIMKISPTKGAPQ
jgi:uncharacterized protein (TIGR00369 family)